MPMPENKIFFETVFCDKIDIQIYTKNLLSSVLNKYYKKIRLFTKIIKKFFKYSLFFNIYLRQGKVIQIVS